MVDIVTLTCPSCGGKLQVSKDLERFACQYCGNEHVVKRSGGTISLAPVMDSLAKIEARVDKTASEIAIPRLKEEIVRMEDQLDSYANKTIFGIVLMIVGGITTSLGIFTNYGIAVFGIFCVIIGASVFSNGMKITSEERKLEKVLKEKKAELIHHESILRQ